MHKWYGQVHELIMKENVTWRHLVSGASPLELLELLEPPEPLERSVPVAFQIFQIFQHPILSASEASSLVSFYRLRVWISQVTKDNIAGAVSSCKTIRLRDGMLDFLQSCQSHDPVIPVSLAMPRVPQQNVFPQQRKLMGPSAQNSSGVHWCRHRVRFNKVPEKVPKVPEKVWEALVQSQVRFKRAGGHGLACARACRSRVRTRMLVSHAHTH